jgi:integrase
MARLKKGSVPAYRKHRPTGKAVVTLSGQDFYLGRFGTKVSESEYDRVVAEWLARGRQPLLDELERDGELTLVELAAQYKAWAKCYYRKGGKVTNEYTAVVNAIKVAAKMYGHDPASAFGPLRLKVVQQAMIKLDWSRKQINKQVGRIVRMFSWATSQELVPPGVAHALREVDGLRQGRTEARETSPILPVDDATIDATVAHLSPLVADMVKLQRLTGCRPEEVCLLRPCDVDRSEPIWVFRPHSHKTAHHGKERAICIGPKGQEILLPYLLRDAETYCFVPSEAEYRRRQEQHATRLTPLSCGNKPGTNKSRSPKRPAGERYTTDSYRRAINRACDKAFPAPEDIKGNAIKDWHAAHRWAPNRLRHAAATEIRKKFGLEAAQVTLGHAAADITQVYAERDLQKAAEVARLIG